MGAFRFAILLIKRRMYISLFPLHDISVVASTGSPSTRLLQTRWSLFVNPGNKIFYGYSNRACWLYGNQTSFCHHFSVPIEDPLRSLLLPKCRRFNIVRWLSLIWSDFYDDCLLLSGLGGLSFKANLIPIRSMEVGRFAWKLLRGQLLLLSVLEFFRSHSSSL